jgi:hypothetical protein
MVLGIAHGPPLVVMPLVVLIYTPFLGRWSPSAGRYHHFLICSSTSRRRETRHSAKVEIYNIRIVITRVGHCDGDRMNCRAFILGMGNVCVVLYWIANSSRGVNWAAMR